MSSSKSPNSLVQSLPEVPGWSAHADQLQAKEWLAFVQPSMIGSVQIISIPGGGQTKVSKSSFSSTKQKCSHAQTEFMPCVLPIASACELVIGSHVCSFWLS